MTDTEKILATLETVYHDAGPELKFNSPFELLISVILSAQCTDARVNKVTKELFANYNTPQAVSEMDIELLEDFIRSCGLYKSKAKNIKTTATALLNDFNGNVPQTREELMSLPGVGRKTANVILSVGYGKPAFAVDTHVFRVANRLGLALAKTPEDVEKQLTAIIPEQKWGKAHHWLIHHGRRICHAQRPACTSCPLCNSCKYYISKQS